MPTIMKMMVSLTLLLETLLVLFPGYHFSYFIDHLLQVYPQKLYFLLAYRLTEENYWHMFGEGSWSLWACNPKARARMWSNCACCEILHRNELIGYLVEILFLFSGTFAFGSRLDNNNTSFGFGFIPLPNHGCIFGIAVYAVVDFCVSAILVMGFHLEIASGCKCIYWNYFSIKVYFGLFIWQ